MNIEKIYQLLKKKYNCEFVITGGDSESDHCLDYLEVDGKIQVFKSKKKKPTLLMVPVVYFHQRLQFF